MTDEIVAGANYVIRFYAEVEELTKNQALYVNILTEIENKFGDDAKEWPDDARTRLIETLQTLRYHAQRSYIYYATIGDRLNIDKKDKEEIEKIYNAFKITFVLNRNDVEKYVLYMNRIIVGELMTDLLKNSQSIIDSLYNTPNNA